LGHSSNKQAREKQAKGGKNLVVFEKIGGGVIFFLGIMTVSVCSLKKYSGAQSPPIYSEGNGANCPHKLRRNERRKKRAERRGKVELSEKGRGGKEMLFSRTGYGRKKGRRVLQRNKESGTEVLRKKGANFFLYPLGRKKNGPPPKREKEKGEGVSNGERLPRTCASRGGGSTMAKERERKGNRFHW